jgi:uncharacterized protein
MYGAHVGVTEPFDWAQPGSWLDVVNGRSSILFAVLAGVSIAIISGGTTPAAGADLRAARIRILVRAVLIFAIGMFLVSLDTRIAIILPMYAVLFVAALPVLRWRPRSLFIAAGVVSVVAPVVVVSISPALQNGGLQNAGLQNGGLLVDLLVTGHYPALIWIAFVLAGLGIGRLDLRLPSIRLGLLAVGAGLAVLGYGAGVAATQAVAASTRPVSYDIQQLATVEAHSGSPFEVIGSAGFAIGVIALCLIASAPLRIPLYPVAAVGSMALTAYTAHVVIVYFIGDSAFMQPDNGLYLWFVLGALVACSIWARLLGRGPLERVLTLVSRFAANPARRRKGR